MRCSLALLLFALAALPAQAIVLGDTLDFNIDHAVLDSDVGYVLNEDGFHLIDVSNPYRVEIIRKIGESTASAFERDGDRLYLRESDGIRVYSIATPGDPLEIGFVPGQYGKIRVAENLLASYGNFSVKLIDLTEISNPNLLATIESLAQLTFPFPVGIRSVAFEGDRLYVMDRGVVRVFDISNPESPREFLTRIFGLGSGPSPIAVTDSVVFAGSEFALRGFDFTDPANPVEVGSPDFTRAEIEDVILLGDTHQLEIRGSTLHAAGIGGYTAFDITDPRNPIKGGTQTQTDTSSIFVLDEPIYPGDNLVLLQASTLTPDANGTYPVIRALDTWIQEYPRVTAFSGSAKFIAVDPPLAVLGFDYGSVFPLDVSDPSDPKLIGLGGQSLDDHFVRDFVLQNGVGYQAVSGLNRGGQRAPSGIFAVDFATPAAPQRGPLIEFSPRPDSLQVVGNRLYAGGDNLRTFDISNPTVPIEIATSRPLGIQKIVVDPIQNRLYAGGTDAVYIFDIRDSANPQLLGQAPGQARDFSSLHLALQHPLLFTSNLALGFVDTLLDVSDPSQAFALSEVTPNNPADFGEFVGEQLRVAETGLRILDISTPTAPHELGQVKIAARSFVSLGRMMFTADPVYVPLDLGPEYEQSKPVEIDLRPRLDVNPVNPTSAGSLKVTLYGGENFDVADVRDVTLMLGPGRGLVTQLSRRDSNRDGYDDISLRVPIADTGISFGDTRVCLRGRTLDGRPFRGCDAIETPAVACGLGFEVAPFLVGLAQLRRRLRRGAPEA